MQIQTKSSLLDMTWVLEKTTGEMSIKDEVVENYGDRKIVKKTINYVGALINLYISDFLLIKSSFNFGLKTPTACVAWSDILYKTEDIYTVFAQETIGFSIPIAYKSTFYPFVGYSYLKLDYKDDYNFWPMNFEGHNIYHNIVFGAEDFFYITKWFQFDVKGYITPFSYYYPRSNTKSISLGIGMDFYFNFEHSGWHLYFTGFRTREKGLDYDEYISSMRDLGITFRIGHIK